MSTRHYFLLYVLSLTILILVAQQQVAPGYMDAEYYFAGGLQIVNGQGFTEPYIWNYLADPPGLPAPLMPTGCRWLRYWRELVC
jgi:hypothetical protein